VAKSQIGAQLFTLRDFVHLCRRDGIDIRDVVCFPRGAVGRLLLRAGFANLGAERVLVRIARPAAETRSHEQTTPIRCRIHSTRRSRKRPNA